MITNETCKPSLRNKINTRYQNTFDKLDKEVQKLTRKINKEEVDLKKAYEHYKEHKLSLEKYRLKREIIMNHLQNYQEDLVKLEDKKNFLENELKKAMFWIENVYKASSQERLSKELIDKLVDKVIVKTKEEFEIIFSFSVNHFAGGGENE